MRQNWERAIASVLLWEGGFAERKDEPGGAVNRGISLQTYRDKYPRATIEELKALTDDQAATFYAVKCAGPVGFYDAPSGLDVVLLHASVMEGVYGATQLLEACMGLPVDGRISPTLFDSVLHPLETAGAMIIRIMHKKMRSAAVQRYGRGWGDRLVAVYEIARSLHEPPMV